MRRMVLLITVACCGLSLVFSNRPQMVMAQTQRSDTIYFLGATRGNDYAVRPPAQLAPDRRS